MALTYWWFLPLGLVLLAAVVLYFWRRKGSASQRIPVAHAQRLTALPEYRKAVQRRRNSLLAAFAAMAVLGGSLLLAAARPVTERTHTPEQMNRDIMLCLDVSGSMLDTDQAIVTVFSSLVDGFKGERIGLTIFDSSSVTVFPLTDDYGFVKEQLEVAGKSLSLDSTNFDFFAGTYEMPGSSLIGDGLASCARGFPQVGEVDRSRSIVFATDNLLAGRPIFTLAEATGLAKTAKIRLYALNPSDFGSTSVFAAPAEGLKKAAKDTGGDYFPLESEKAVESIVKKVQSTEASLTKGAPQKVVLDRPVWPLAIALIALLGLGAATWRLRR